MMKASSDRRVKGNVLSLCLGLAFWLVASSAQAATVTYALDYIFSPLTGSGSPLATVSLTDLGNAVEFTVLNQAGAGSKLDSLYFNFLRGSINPDQLTFSNVTAVAGTYSTLLAPFTSATLAGLKADGDGYFDGKFEFTMSNFLGHGQILSFELSAAGQDLSVDDFNFLSLPGGGTGSYIMASHIQNMPVTGSSVWVGTVAPVPSPAAAYLFVSGLAGLVGAMRNTRMLA